MSRGDSDNLESAMTCRDCVLRQLWRIEVETFQQLSTSCYQRVRPLRPFLVTHALSIFKKRLNLRRGLLITEN